MRYSRTHTVLFFKVFFRQKLNQYSLGKIGEGYSYLWRNFVRYNRSSKISTNMVNIAINGFGRIGRSFFRAFFDMRGHSIVAVNDLTDIPTLAYLLKYDSVYGRYASEIKAGDGVLEVDGREVKVFTEKDPANLPWKDLGVDIVVESTGFFTSAEKAQAHVSAGAKRVVITAPAKGDVTTALVGVNDDRFGGDNPLTCNASCTTNSVAPVMAILDEVFGVDKASMITAHAYTASESLVDGSGAREIRLNRAAPVNIIPSTTGAAKAVIQALPGLAGKFKASSIRVPVIVGSLSIITALLEKKTTTEEVNDIFRKAARSDQWSKILSATEDPIVSTDVIGQPYGAIIDLALTDVLACNSCIRHTIPRV